MKKRKPKKVEDRAISAPPTLATSSTRNGGYTQVEVWTNRRRYRVTFDRYLNLVSVAMFTEVRSGLHWAWWVWRQQFHRTYKRRHRTLKPLYVDVVVAALEKAKDDRAARATKP